MTKLGKAFGKKFEENKDAVRVREFELGGHNFKVRVPLTVESDAIQQRVLHIDEEKVERYYQESVKEIEANKDAMGAIDGIEFKDNDIIVQGRSMREAAKMKHASEIRVLEMVKLLVPEDKNFDMADLTYEDIEEVFPLPVQLELVEKISEVISFDYHRTRKK